MKKAYLITCKEVYETPEKYIILDQKKANDFFESIVKQIFENNETTKDSNNNDIKKCLDIGLCESNLYTATIEEITVIQ